MNDVKAFLDLPITAQAAAICFVVCATGLLLVILTTPRRDYFFLRWRPEIRLLALLVSPVLLIIWPIVLYALFLKSRGIEWDDPDFFDD
jgi:hypothetical protein